MAVETSRIRVQSAPTRRASVLLLVLVVVAMMSLATGSYLVSMHNEHTATRHVGTHQQARLLAESGIEFLKVFLAQTDEAISLQGGVQDNPSSMQAILVADDVVEDFRGRFSIVAPSVSLGYYSGYQFGLEDESAKLNLNALLQESSNGNSGGAVGGSGSTDDDGTDNSNQGSSSGSGGTGLSGAGDSQNDDDPQKRLMALPGMTEDIADAILDWIDDDDTARPLGAESAYYQSLSPAYEPRNGPISSLDELLPVRGVTPELLYGQDSNRNFVLETHETPRGALTLIDNINGQLDRGWSAYLTLSSAERSAAADGTERIDLNGSDLNQLSNALTTALGSAQAKFIVAYRQFGAADENATGTSTNASSLEIDFEKDANNIGSLLDLVGINVAFKKDDQAPIELVASPWQESGAGGSQELLQLMDRATVSSNDTMVGRVNVNTASRVVLMSVPKMTSMIADQILSRRLPVTDPVNDTQRHAVWLLGEGIVDLQEMKALDPYINAGGDVYSGQVVGFFEAAPGQSRLEVIIDRSGESTKIVGRNDISSLGPGYTKDSLLGALAIPSEPTGNSPP